MLLPSDRRLLQGEGVKPYVTLSCSGWKHVTSHSRSHQPHRKHKWVYLSLSLNRSFAWPGGFPNLPRGFGSMIYARGLKKTHKTDDRIQLCKPAFPLHNVSDRYATLTAMGFGFMGIKWWIKRSAGWYEVGGGGGGEGGGKMPLPCHSLPLREHFHHTKLQLDGCLMSKSM